MSDEQEPTPPGITEPKWGVIRDPYYSRTPIAAEGERIRFGSLDDYANWLEVRRLPNGKYEITSGGPMTIEPQNSHTAHINMRAGFRDPVRPTD